MVEKKSPMFVENDNDASVSYEIKIKGYLDEHWSDWLGSLEICQDEHGNSLLSGIVPDQAALHGILNQIRDLGLTLISIKSKGPEDDMGQT